MLSYTVLDPQGKKLHVIPLNSVMFRVQSRSNPAIWHFPWITDTDSGCDCDGFKYRSRCAHVYAIALVTEKLQHRGITLQLS